MSADGGMAEVTRASIDSAEPPGAAGSVQPTDLNAAAATSTPVAGAGATGPVERVMSTVIRKLAWSRLAKPRVAVTVAGLGLLLGAFVGATAPNNATLHIRLPLTILPSLQHYTVITMAILYLGDILACLGLAGMLWAHSQGWRPNPWHLLAASAAVVAVMVSLTPVGSSDTASYAAFGRIAALGGNPYETSPAKFLGHHYAAYQQYYTTVGSVWKKQESVYGPIATSVQHFAAWIGGPNVMTTIWILMILNGMVFIGTGWLLLKTSDDPVRATLLWTANPVLIQQLVSGGHLDTFVAAGCICAIQVARRFSGRWGDVLTGVLIGLACGVKANAGLVAVGLAYPMLRRHEWLRITRIAVVSLGTLAILYASYGLRALTPLWGGSKWVILPSPWRFAQMLGLSITTIDVLWPIAMIVVAWLVYQRISSDQPGEVVAPFALTYAWIVVAPWVFPWYTAITWAALTQVPRNRMTRWLTIVTVVLALWHSSGGTAPTGQV
jgi:hypothetical protein